MELFQGILFGALIVMVLVWFGCVSRLARRLRERHPEKYDAMSLDELWPEGLGGWIRGFDNSRPAMAILRFLWRREDYRMRDDGLVKLAGFMRVLGLAYVVVFVVFAGSIVQMSREASDVRERIAQPSSPAVDLQYRANELHRKGKYAEAIAVYDRILGPVGADPELLYWRAMAHWQLRHEDDALRDFKRVIDLQPGNFEAHLYSDRILSRQRRWDDCIDLWNRYLRAVPRDAAAHYERGGSFFHKGDIPSAHADLARACELGKTDACARAERLKSGL